MILYGIKKTDCLSALMSAVSVGKCRYWTNGVISIRDVNFILPKLISRYELQLGDNQSQERMNKSRLGLPVWTVIIHYNPKNIGQLEFWLMTTGYRPSQRSKTKNKDEIDTLNKKLMHDENLKPIITQNPHNYLTFNEYVLGLYITYPELKDGIENDYLFPHNYGIPIDPNIIPKSKSLSFKSINGIQSDLNLDNKLSESEEARYENIKGNFGFLYLKDTDVSNFTHDEARKLLKKKYGVVADPDSTYQDTLKLLGKHLKRTNNQYLHIFKRKATKRIRFTWYLNDEFLDDTRLDIEKKIKNISSRPKQFEDSMRRLYARGNFHGVRYQIGKISGRVKMLVREHYPKIYNRLQFPEMLHYVRFMKVPYSNFKEFQNACINETIMFEKNTKLREEQASRYKMIRTAIRTKNPTLNDASPTTLNKMINEIDTKKPSRNVAPTKEEIESFILQHKEMNPALISDTY